MAFGLFLLDFLQLYMYYLKFSSFIECYNTLSIPWR